MSFQLNSIAGSVTAAQLAQQANTAHEQEQTRVYQQALAQELARHAQQTEEEVRAANQEGHRRIGDRPPEQERRRRSPEREHEEAAGPEPEQEEFAADAHRLDVKDNDTAATRAKPAGHIDLTV